MKWFAFAMLLVIPAFGQNQPSPVAAACGDLQVSIAVNLDNAKHAIEPPEAGKARVYFVQDAGIRFTPGYPTTKVGIDGQWVGQQEEFLGSKKKERVSSGNGQDSTITPAHRR